MSKDYVIYDQQHNHYWHNDKHDYGVGDPKNARRYTLEEVGRVCAIENQGDSIRISAVHIDSAQPIVEKICEAEEYLNLYKGMFSLSVPGIKPKVTRQDVYKDVFLKALLGFWMLLAAGVCVIAIVLMYDAMPTFTKILGLSIVAVFAVAEFVYRRKR